MDIVALLPDHLLHPFRGVSAAVHTVRAVRSLRELDATLCAHRVDILVVDPQLGGSRNVPALATLLDRHRTTVHVVVYTTLSADGLHACHALGARGYRHVVLFGVDDDPRQFRMLLETVPADALADGVLAGVRDRLDHLTPALAGALEAAFRAPHAVNSVDRLAARARMPRRTLYDALDRAGFVTPARVLSAARVLRAYHHLRADDARVRDVSAKLGYPTPDAMSAEVRAVTAFLPSSLARELEPEDVVARIAAFIREPSRVHMPAEVHARSRGLRGA